MINIVIIADIIQINFAFTG